MEEEQCVYADREFPIVYFTSEERKVLSFWCPKKLAVIEEANKYELIERWNRKPGQPRRSHSWFSILWERSTKGRGD